MMKSVYQTVECAGCGAHILTDTRGPLTTDPNEHEDDCPQAEAWPTDPQAELDAAFARI
jgi:hypothetical protein